MTWREKIADANKAIERAYEQRREVFRSAQDAGLSLREIGEAAGLTRVAVHNIVGKQGERSSLLDTEAP